MKPTYILLGLAVVVIGVGAAFAATRLTSTTPSLSDEVAIEPATLSGVQGEASDVLQGDERVESSGDERKDESMKKDENEFEVEDESKDEAERAETVPQGSTVPLPPTAPTVASYSAAEVATHGGETSCWTIVRGEVYNVTAWIGEHPGGERSILSMCGKDATSAFEGKHGGEKRPQAELTKYKIGILR